MWFARVREPVALSPTWPAATIRSRGKLAMAIISSRSRHRAPFFGAAVLAGAALAGVLSAAPAGASASTQPRTASATTSFTVNGFFNGVTATSASDAWAVGGNNGSTLIAHWNGTAWKRVPSPNRPAPDVLFGVAAASPSNAWAAGLYTTNASPGGEPLIERWNGTTWQEAATPSYSGLTNVLYGVAATSATNAWAVGTADFRPLILHWDGTTWKQVPSPAPPAFDTLSGVAATSATSAWAVGSDSVRGTLSFHWNGTTWTRTPGPSASLDLFSGVAATSATNAWAVGSADNSTLIARWNGTAWKRVPSPNPTEDVHALNGVVATSATNAWAVGYDSTFNGGGQKT